MAGAIRLGSERMTDRQAPLDSTCAKQNAAIFASFLSKQDSSQSKRAFNATPPLKFPQRLVPTAFLRLSR